MVGSYCFGIEGGVGAIGLQTAPFQGQTEAIAAQRVGTFNVFLVQMPEIAGDVALVAVVNGRAAKEVATLFEFTPIGVVITTVLVDCMHVNGSLLRCLFRW